MAILIVMLLLQTGASEPGFLVITSEKTNLSQITYYQLRQIFLRKLDRVHGVKVTPIQLEAHHKTRADFEMSVLGSDFRQHEYWLKQRLQGGEKPPLTVASEAYLLVFVERNPGFIGYVSRSVSAELSNFKIKVLSVSN